MQRLHLPLNPLQTIEPKCSWPGPYRGTRSWALRRTCSTSGVSRWWTSGDEQHICFLLQLLLHLLLQQREKVEVEAEAGEELMLHLLLLLQKAKVEEEEDEVAIDAFRDFLPQCAIAS